MNSKYIKNIIENDILVYNKTIIKLLLILTLLIKKPIFYLICIIFLLYYLKNKSEIKIIEYTMSWGHVATENSTGIIRRGSNFSLKHSPLITDLSHKSKNIISISNNKRNIIRGLKENKLLYFVKMFTGIFMFYLLNNKCLIPIIELYVRNYSYNNINIIFRYPLNMNIPNKLIMLVSHANNVNDYDHMFLLKAIYPDHKKILITRNWYNKHTKKIGAIIGSMIGQYSITDENKNSKIYSEMTSLIKKHEKIIILIFPEGHIIRKTNINLNNTSIEHIKTIKDFNVDEQKCFNYRKGAFILSLMNSIPVQLSLFYLPVPDYTHTYFNKQYKIKHIDHLGISLSKPFYYKLYLEYKIDNNNLSNDSDILNYIDEHSNSIENYRQIMETKFRKLYIKTLFSAHKFNITDN